MENHVFHFKVGIFHCHVTYLQHWDMHPNYWSVEKKNKHYKLYRPYPRYCGLNKSLTRWCPVISWDSELGHLAPGYHSAPQTHPEPPKDHHIAEGRFFGATTPGRCVACSDRGGVPNAFHHGFVWERDLILTILQEKSGKYFKEINYSSKQCNHL